MPLGDIAQLGERVLCKHEVVGSIPSSSTTLPCHAAAVEGSSGSKSFALTNAYAGGMRISDIVKRECARAVAKAAGPGAFGKHKAVGSKEPAAGLYRDRGWR